jgi:hypothetical protein
MRVTWWLRLYGTIFVIMFALALLLHFLRLT